VIVSALLEARAMGWHEAHLTYEEVSALHEELRGRGEPVGHSIVTADWSAIHIHLR
jgi:hypothetical protein